MYALGGLGVMVCVMRVRRRVSVCVRRVRSDGVRSDGMCMR